MKISMVKKLEIKIEFEEIDSFDELDEDWQNLYNHAQEACSRSYAPYSNFHVGAAVLLENGKIVTGNNQENASYPEGLCAERVVLFNARSQYPECAVVKLVVTAQVGMNGNFVPVTPCGACRQVMCEYEGQIQKPMQILMKSRNYKFHLFKNAAVLLPLNFSKASFR